MSAVFSGYTESNLRISLGTKIPAEKAKENRALVYNMKNLELMSLLCTLTFNF